MAAKTDVHTDLDIRTVIEILELLVASKKVTVNEKLDRPAGGEVYVCEKSDKGMQSQWLANVPVELHQAEVAKCKTGQYPTLAPSQRNKVEISLV